MPCENPKGTYGNLQVRKVDPDPASSLKATQESLWNMN
jgi:hypothetical protein